MKFYTNVSLKGGVVTIRGWNFGERINQKIKYEPTFYLPTQKQSEYKTVEGQFVEPMKFDSIREARDFAQKYDEVENFKIYGSTLFQYCCLNEEYGNEYDPEKVRTVNIDIEVGSEEGFPEPELANQPVTAITMSYRGRYYVLGVGEYNNTRDDVVYARCRSEHELLSKFLTMWRKIDADIVTGWNVEFFDIPYLVRRMNKILGEDETKRLSPLFDIRERRIKKHNKELLEYELIGMQVLDYLELYRKFTYTQQESYRLDHIGHVELGVKKLDYSEVETLHQLYKTDYQKFIDYNIRDVEIVDQLEDKMKLIEMALAIAYDAKVNYGDVFTQVRMWDVLIHNYLLKSKVVVPPKESTRKDSQYAGAYVKPPQVGMHGWLMSFDLNSLYPHLIMQYNISPETFVKDQYVDMSVDKILDKKVDIEYDGLCLTPGGHFFRKDQQGFLPEMMQRMYDERKLYKKKMLEAQNELEEVNRLLNGQA
jgi:DNA polymerase elongation subunit (family B)